MGEALLKEEQEPAVMTARFSGVEALCDICLYEKAYGDTYTLVLMSLYGSESQCRAIFAALTQWKYIEINGVSVRSGGNMRYKSTRVGYGKYHAVVWCDNPISKTVLCFGGDDIAAWDSFLQKRLIPYVKEWIPKIVDCLLDTEAATVLEGFGADGYIVNTSDEAICNLIVERIA